MPRRGGAAVIDPEIHDGLGIVEFSALGCTSYLCLSCLTERSITNAAPGSSPEHW